MRMLNGLELGFVAGGGGGARGPAESLASDVFLPTLDGGGGGGGWDGGGGGGFDNPMGDPMGGGGDYGSYDPGCRASDYPSTNMPMMAASLLGGAFAMNQVANALKSSPGGAAIGNAIGAMAQGVALLGTAAGAAAAAER